MNILHIEDDDIKAKTLLNFIKSLPTKYSIERRVSWQSGIIEIINNGDLYDFLILDMSMPRYDYSVGDVNEEFETFAGWDILKEMKRRNIHIKCIVLTAFDYFGEGPDIIDRHTLDQALKSDFSDFYEGMIFFNTTQTAWKDELVAYL